MELEGGLGQTVLSGVRRYSMLIALLIIIVLFGITTQGVLLVPRNVSNLVFQNAYVAILAVGMLLCILTGGNIDLSVGSVVGFIGAVAGELMIVQKMPVLPSILICLGVGLLIGFFQGGCIAYIGVPPFIATLAGMMIFRGLTLVVLKGLTLAPFPDSFLDLSTGHIPDFFGISGIGINMTCIIFGILATLLFLGIKLFGRFRKIKKGYETGSTNLFILNIVLISVALLAVTFRLAQHSGIPTVLIILVIIVIIYAVLTSMTVPGRYLYALGGNAKAARLSGIDTKKVMFLAYTNMSFLAAVAGLVFAARLNSANPSAGLNFELDAIGSCFIGGASAYGGIGTVGGVLIGATFMGIMNNGMNIMGFQTATQQVVKGLVLLVAVAFDVMSKRKSR
ncbi:MAG: sugar ABC transporter permease [Clostridiales bacterium]|nr:sugar ABC transporter permease [Clostridiales bacterium]